MWVVGLTAAFVVAVTLLGTVRTRATAAAPSEREIQAGRAVYVTHCATCHGDGGRGDGVSAAGFATKPSNLTDGRLMNGLPDEFLASVIRGGGPAQGLAPTMPPFERSLSEAQVGQVIAYVRSLATPARPAGSPNTLVRIDPAPRQPILFNHVIHAGSFGIACQHCHTDARRSEYAGLPSVERCLGCHKIIGAQDNPEIAKIADYGRRGAPIPWVRVFKVPEFTHFPHKPHIQADIACQTCHGAIERMPVVGARTGPSLVNDLQYAVGLKPTPPPLTMGWCLECHRRENATRGLHAPLDCVTCHH
jgi:mono/diheme cytochrome c family protein